MAAEAATFLYTEGKAPSLMSEILVQLPHIKNHRVAELVAELRSGDPDAFAVIYSRFGPVVHGILLLRVGGDDHLRRRSHRPEQEALRDVPRPAGGDDRELEPSEAGTKLRFEHSVFGKASKQTRDSLNEGWQLLFGRCLKHYAETGEGPTYDDR